MFEIEKLMVCIAFHYLPERLKYLEEIVKNQANLAKSIDTYVLTQTKKAEEIEQIKAILPSHDHINYEILTFDQLRHPYLLTWTHKDVFKNGYFSNKNYDYFLYVEDDIKITHENILYWKNTRPKLKQYGLYPSFMRVEWNDSLKEWMVLDIDRSASRIKLDTEKKAHADQLVYVNKANPYQGMTLYDRELLAEHFESPSFTPSYIHEWGIQEKAASGQTFINIPEGFSSRTVIPVDPFRKEVIRDCLIHHIPNKYTNIRSVHENIPVSSFIS